MASGGVVGAALRWLVLTSLPAPGLFAWPVLAVNVSGSFVLGCLLGAEARGRPSRLMVHDAGAIGFCGGFTTLSTFALDVVDLGRAGHRGLAGLYAVVSVMAALVAVAVGAAAVHSRAGLRAPVEEQP